MMLSLRLLHILTGIAWVGGMTFFFVFLLPGLQGDPATTGKVMQGLARRGYMQIMPGIALVTILSGLWLVWITSGGDVHGYAGSRSGHVYLTSGGIAIVTFFIGVFLGRPIGMKAAQISAAMATATDAGAKTELMAEMAGLQKRGALINTIVLGGLLIAAAGMAVARYV